MNILESKSSAYIVTTVNQVRWSLTKPDGRMFNGIDHLNNTDHSDIDTLLDAVVARLHSIHGSIDIVSVNLPPFLSAKCDLRITK